MICKHAERRIYVECKLLVNPLQPGKLSEKNELGWFHVVFQLSSFPLVTHATYDLQTRVQLVVADIIRIKTRNAPKKEKNMRFQNENEPRMAYSSSPASTARSIVKLMSHEARTRKGPNVLQTRLGLHMAQFTPPRTGPPKSETRQFPTGNGA